MFLDSSLFPPDIEYKLNPEYGETKTFRKQVRIYIGVELFAVINSDYYENEWGSPAFVILRAHVPFHELEVIPDISIKAQQIMKVIQEADKAQMEKLLK